MNGYERIKAALEGKKPDKRPVMLHNFQNCVYEMGITFDQFRSDARLAAECFIKNAEKYDLDGILIDFDTATLAGACGCEVVFPADKAAIPAGHILKDIEDAAGLKPVRLEDSRQANHWLETSRRVAEYFGKDKYIRCNCDQAPFSLASMLRGSQELMMDLTDEDYEEDVFRLLEYCTDVTGQFIRLAAQTGAHCVSNGDSVAGPAMISPHMYKKFAVPYEKLIVEEAHRNHMDYFLHICGNTTPILEEFPELHTEAMELDYKTDIKEIYRVIGDNTALSGILDPSGVFLRGNPELVRQEVRKILETYENSYRLILCSGCALAPETPEENMRAFVDEARKA